MYTIYKVKQHIQKNSVWKHPNMNTLAYYFLQFLPSHILQTTEQVQRILYCSEVAYQFHFQKTTISYEF